MAKLMMRPLSLWLTIGWIVEYGGMQVECRDEADAKALAARLRRKGHRLWARTSFNATPARYVESDEISSWLEE